jgi:hypothetical protein
MPSAQSRYNMRPRFNDLNNMTEFVSIAVIENINEHTIDMAISCSCERMDVDCHFQSRLFHVESRRAVAEFP